MNEKEIKNSVVADYMLIQGISEALGAAYKQAISMYVADCYCESLVNFRSCLSNAFYVTCSVSADENNSGQL